MMVKTACELTRGKPGDARINIVIRDGVPRLVVIPELVEVARKSLRLTPTRK